MSVLAVRLGSESDLRIAVGRGESFGVLPDPPREDDGETPRGETTELNELVREIPGDLLVVSVFQAEHAGRRYRREKGDMGWCKEVGSMGGHTCTPHRATPSAPYVFLCTSDQSIFSLPSPHPS